MPEEVQPTPGQGEEQVTTQPGAGPWADSLNTRFEDPEIRQTVDAFLREDVQPYVTRLEQGRNSDAEQLYAELQEKPGQTYLAISEELFGAEVSQKVQDLLLSSFGGTEGDGDDLPPEVTPGAPVVPADDAPLNPRVERMVKQFEADENQRAYDAELARVKAKAAAEGKPEVIDELIHPFVMATGDFDKALEGYAKYYNQFRQQFSGPQDEAAQAAAAAANQPPPVIGSDSATTTTPPVQTKYSSIDEALDDFFAEGKKAPPAPVGST